MPRERVAPDSGIVVGGKIVRLPVGRWLSRACGAAARAIVVGGHVVRSSVGRKCGAYGAVVSRPGVQRARHAAARGIVVGRHVVRSLVGQMCGAHAALLLVAATFGNTSCGHRSVAGAVRTRRCCSCRCRWGESCAVLGRPLVAARTRRCCLWHRRWGASRAVVGRKRERPL